jgi:putative flippase GtrA
VQFAKFCCVGLTGYAVNLAVYAPLVKLAGVSYLPAAICSFTAAVTNNYLWNRFWTFRHDRGHVYRQAIRFLCVSLVGLAANLVVLRTLVIYADAVSAQAIAVIVVTPLSFIANKLWSFPTLVKGSRLRAPRQHVAVNAEPGGSVP